MKQKELNKIIKLHLKWLMGDSNGVRADLSNADLRGANLRGADLRDANLDGADLSNADLSNADLRGADLWGADLDGADLRNANLADANLADVDLADADLRGADLWGADLDGADLSNARLNWANWHEARGLKVYVAGLQSSRENAQLVYIPSLDVTTTGCWQDTWEATKKRVAGVYKDKDEKIYYKYQLAFKYIEGQMEADK